MHLLRRVEKYLRRTGTPPTRFGREAVGDPRFDSDLRTGREARADTVARVIDFLERHEIGGRPWKR